MFINQIQSGLNDPDPKLMKLMAVVAEYRVSTIVESAVQKVF
jgi:hypothetical protein